MFDAIKPHLTKHNFISIAILFVIASVGYSTLKVIANNYRLQQRVDELTLENDVLKLQNQEIEYRIAYYKTDAFVEKKARDVLGLQAPGEKVVIFPDRIPKDLEPETGSNADGTPPRTTEEYDNVDQWLYFLFGKTPG